MLRVVRGRGGLLHGLPHHLHPRVRRDLGAVLDRVRRAGHGVGDLYAADEIAIDHFAKSQCHQTNVLFEHAAAAGGSCAPDMLAAMTDDVNAACCEQSGAYECTAGTPWSCDATCALEFVPFWEKHARLRFSHCGQREPGLFRDAL